MFKGRKVQVVQKALVKLGLQLGHPLLALLLLVGGDRLGRDVLAKAIKGTEISVFVGVFAALVATLIGTLLGAFAGFFGGKVGDFLEWITGVLGPYPYGDTLRLATGPTAW